MKTFVRFCSIDGTDILRRIIVREMTSARS